MQCWCSLVIPHWRSRVSLHEQVLNDGAGHLESLLHKNALHLIVGGKVLYFCYHDVIVCHLYHNVIALA